MDRKKIKLLVPASLTKGELDQEKVMRIVKHLTVQELKVYIQALKAREKERTLVVEMPKLDKKYSQQLATLYPNKKIVLKENPELLLGIRMYDNDDIYEVSLRNTFEKLNEFAIEAYDR